MVTKYITYQYHKGKKSPRSIILMENEGCLFFVALFAFFLFSLNSLSSSFSRPSRGGRGGHGRLSAHRRVNWRPRTRPLGRRRYRCVSVVISWWSVAPFSPTQTRGRVPPVYPRECPVVWPATRLSYASIGDILVLFCPRTNTLLSSTLVELVLPYTGIHKPIIRSY